MTIAGVEIKTIDRYSDERGTFTEIARVSSVGDRFAQWSHSHSKAGVLRGLHFHRKQTDFWYLARGTARIALVDLRAGAQGLATMSWIADANEPTTIVIPPGIAHGYLAITDIDMLYMTSAEWDPDDEFGIAWNDPALAITWEVGEPRLSDRDRTNPRIDWDTIGTFS